MKAIKDPTTPPGYDNVWRGSRSNIGLGTGRVYHLVHLHMGYALIHHGLYQAIERHWDRRLAQFNSLSRS